MCVSVLPTNEVRDGPVPTWVQWKNAIEQNTAQSTPNVTLTHNLAANGHILQCGNGQTIQCTANAVITSMFGKFQIHYGQTLGFRPYILNNNYPAIATAELTPSEYLKALWLNAPTLNLQLATHTLFQCSSIAEHFTLSLASYTAWVQSELSHKLLQTTNLTCCMGASKYFTNTHSAT